MLDAGAEMRIGDTAIPVRSVKTLIIGSGAAGLNAALQLVRRGQRNIAIVTERWGAGASNEAGSDKQTYYKLSLAHDIDDSPTRMAEVLVSGGCMHGDIALCEAQHSAEAFHNLASLGVPFPHDAYGAYVGYRTDNDPAGRATSAGPLTSHYMCECLGAAVREQGVTIFDNHQIIALLTRKGHEKRIVCGAIAVDIREVDSRRSGFIVFNAVNIILATGGPGGMYRSSVYPESQVGSTGLALAIGAAAQNLTESQFGLASVNPRWNLSGSYQQSIPRYVSADAGGGDEREFLNEWFPDMKTLATAVFRKGYEWPFDCAKIAHAGSSLIDLLVYREMHERGRRVFLDYSRNPDGGGVLEGFWLGALDDEARVHLSNSDALLETPVQRLVAMNEPAYRLFRDRGVDLAHDHLEIAVCAQHSNGGLRGNMWWESSIGHLFPIGEVNGSHGVRRPGGAALNAGQVGGIRAALYISRRYDQAPPDVEMFADEVRPQVSQYLERARRMLAAGDGQGGVRPDRVIAEIQDRMSVCAAIIRDPIRIGEEVKAAWRLLEESRQQLAVSSASELPSAFRALDLCLTHVVYLESLREYLARGGGSRGSFLVLDRRGQAVHDRLGDSWRFIMADRMPPEASRILEIRLEDGGHVRTEWVDPRPIPRAEGWFETVWDDYRHDRVVR